MPINFGFTPNFQRTLASMGIDFNQMRAGMDSHLGSTWKESKIDLNAPYFKLLAQGIDPEKFSQIVNTVSTSDIRKAGLTPEVQKLYDQIIKMRGVEIQRGAQDTAPKEGWFKKGLDYISRPGRAVTTGMYEGNIGVQKAQNEGKSFAGWHGFDEFIHGAKAGFTGKESKTGTDILRDQLGIKNKVALFAGGLGIDVAADPISYTGIGVSKKAIESISKINATKNAAKETIENLSKGPKLRGFKIPTTVDLENSLGGETTKLLTPSAKVAALKTGQASIDLVSSKLGSQAAKTAQLSLANDLTKIGQTSKEALANSKRWLNPNFANTPEVLKAKTAWTTLLKQLPDVKSLHYLDKTYPEIFKETQNLATKQLTEILHANMEQQIKRTLNLRGLGTDLPLLPIPNIAIKSMSSLAKAPVINHAVTVFNKSFNTGSNFDHELYVTKSRAAGKAEQRIGLGQKKLVNAFQGITKDRRIGWMNALVSSPTNYGRGILKSVDGTDLGDFTKELFQHFGQYIDWTGRGAGIISLKKLNAYLPHTMRFDTSILTKNAKMFNPASSYGGQNFLNLLHLHKDVFKTIDPQNLMYHLHIGIEKALARDQFMRAIADMGIPLVSPQLLTNPATGRLGKQGSTVARQLVSKHGYEPIITRTSRETLQEVDPSYTRYLKDRVFHPEIKKGLVHMITMMDDDKQIEGFGRFYDKALSYFKKAVTLPNPGYHIRNSVGDLLTSYTDGVGGSRGLASYAQAAKTMKFINPISKNEELQKILTAAVTTEGKIKNPINEVTKLLTNSTNFRPNLIIKKNPKWKDIAGQYVTAEHLHAAYQHMGLKRGFVATDIARELRGNPNEFLKAIHKPMDAVLKASQEREDYFRMAHFIDRIKRSKAPSFEEAAKEASYYVKKFHFDYTDVTPIERAVFSRALPFYKFQRFAAPLMLQMFFATPGKILNAQKVLNNMAFSQGFSSDGYLPTADQILPEYMRDAMMIPLFTSPTGNTSYFGNSLLPSTSIFSQTLGLEGSSPREIGGSIGQNLMQNTTPYAQIPAELYFGKKILGKGQVPVQDSKGSYLPYLLSKTPVSNIGFNKPGKTDFSTSLLNFLTGLGLSENTPARQTSELYREKDVINKHRKQSGYQTPKPISQTPPFFKPK